MVPRLEYKESKDSTIADRESVWWFLDKSLQQHKAPILESLYIKLDKRCPIDADLNRKIANAVDRRVRMLILILTWSAKPISLPTKLYTCENLVGLKLYTKILLDVPSSVSLTSLKILYLSFVVYKDELSLVRLLSGCPILEQLTVYRLKNDNLINVIVEKPSLKSLDYTHCREESDHVANVGDIAGSLVIDCPSLKRLFIYDSIGDSCSSKNIPCLDQLFADTYWYHDAKFLIPFSSITCLRLALCQAMVDCCIAVCFPRLTYLSTWPSDSYWMEPLMYLLENSPTLKHLTISSSFTFSFKDFPLSWIQPNSVPKCLSSNLEILEWHYYEGRIEEQELAAYILGNSKCLKKADFFLLWFKCPEKRRKMREELNSMPRASPTLRLRLLG